MKVEIGDRFQFVESKKWWGVRAVGERFVVLTQQRAFHPKGELVYTIVDWQKGIRSSCNALGGGWEVDTDEQCAELIQLLEDPTHWMELSRRRQIYTTIYRWKGTRNKNQHFHIIGCDRVSQRLNEVSL